LFKIAITPNLRIFGSKYRLLSSIFL